MAALNLSLRQRKLLHMLQEQTTYITGSELAKQLNVSPRTIRSDVVEINQNLTPHHARITSERSKGYLFYAEDPEKIYEMNRIETAFFTKEDRIRYLAFRLCLSDEPLNLYDLEDEMYVSHTTLEHDLHDLKMKYTISAPYIEINQARDDICYEQDENKRRMVLNHLFHEDWNYNTKGNAYYGYHFLNGDILDYIMEEVPQHLDKYGISLEDPTLVSLNLAIAIMYHRVQTGHSLPQTAPVMHLDIQAASATKHLFDALEGQFHCTFSQSERDSIYEKIASGHLVNVSDVNLQTISDYFDSTIVDFADTYLNKIKNVFGLDFTFDEDFYITLLMYLRYLKTPVHIFNEQGNHNIIKKNLLEEYEIAYLIEDIALEHLGYYMNQTELLYLAYCISGALEFLLDTHPETKLKTVICCHLNMPATWAINRKIMGAFNKYINVTALLPVNVKNTYDFSNTDLVISTVQKTITDNPGTETLRISTLMSPKDYLNLSTYIQKKRLEKLCVSDNLCIRDLLVTAYWHEKINMSDRFSIIELMTKDFLDDGLTTDKFMEDILRRESILTNDVDQGILFLHSLVASKKTKLSVTTLDHRIIWNSHKIRIIIMAAFRTEDIPSVFRLIHTFYDDSINMNVLKMLKTKKEIIDFFTE